ncbi:MAG: DNRLRE domain-containing protein [Sarcina sp.]
MKSFKIPSNSSLFISKKNSNTNLNNSCNLVVGQYETDEFRGLIEFNLNPRIFDFKIARADLVIYLSETKIDLNIESFMLNIGRNFDTYNPNKVTWDTAPNFFQEAHFSKIETNYSCNYIMIDISKILNYWIKNRVSVFCITLLGLAQNSLLYIANTNNKKPFLEIFLESGCKKDNEVYSNKKNLDISIPIKCDENSVISPSQNYSHSPSNLISSPTNAKNSIACGNFISTNGELAISNFEAYVKFNIETNNIRTNLNITKDGIFILTKGLYKIDYFLNCRSEPFSTVELELDCLSIPTSKIQISSSDSPTSTSTIIDVGEDNMILKLKLSTNNSILITTGICASLTLVKIN